jgi:hypothetical protein
MPLFESRVTRGGKAPDSPPPSKSGSGILEEWVYHLSCPPATSLIPPSALTPIKRFRLSTINRAKQNPSKLLERGY